ncbi:P-loop containing nucleoside triphosphate hydrolase protein [Lactarius hatsudake]|nr:P-loop containing nucleoside triphosphate hydrolase protein [Lactarius hatsudake]
MPNSPEFSSGVHKHLLAGLNLFNKALLKSEADIATAVDVLEGTLDDYSTGPIIHFSLRPEHPYAFEFMISSAKDVTSAYILDFILDKFSSNISSFSSSLGYEIVSRLSRSLSQLPYPSNKLPEGLNDRCHHTEIAPTILEDLFTLLQSSFFEAESSTRKTAQQSKTSRRKNTTRAHAEIEARLSQALRSRFPETRESAEDIMQSTIDEQKDTLKFFFTLLQRFEIAELVRDAYFQGSIPQGVRVDAVTSPQAEATLSSPIAGGDPLQADLYFPSVAGFGEWRILCSHGFLSDITRDNALSKAVLGRLRELSLGCFSETNRKRLTRNSPIDIFRARLPGGERLVYLIDVVPEFGIDYGIQVLRVLGIYTMDKLKRTDWDKIGRYRARNGREYIEKCKAKKSPGAFFYDPMTCGGTPTQAATIATDSNPQEVEDVDEIHRLFDLEQYSILSQNVMRDVLEGHAYSHVFQVSWEEKEVVEFTKSSFVLGRSGTGKTTVIVFKIFGIERAWQNRGSVGPRPRQLFITKSRLLADKVEQDYVNLLFSLSEDPDTPQYIRDRIHLWKSRRKNNVLDPDDAQGKRDDLPEKFSELQDGHFPLFITVDTLWSLLEADMEPPPSKSRYSRPQKRNDKWLGHTDLVAFDVFRREYWRHLPQNLTKGIAPSVAFSDIIGIIKGSEKSLESSNHALGREAYESLTNRNYALFEAYQRLKRERRQRDLADRTHDLLDEIKENGLKGVLVDFVYVDEVQDLLLIDARLIVSLCRNPDGFLWAGDTAQTISIGSAFSFKELGAFVYRYQRSIRAIRGAPSQPKGFQLLVNYRSHGGIVKCANAIIQLLKQFPGAIDVLQPEAGIAGKEIPVFFHGECLPSRERDFFLLSTGRLCKLGSKQCIIVRDEAARKKLRSDIGPVAIILTLFNSKGLEYDDVILYNFFGESANANLWRHLTDAQLYPLEDLKHAPLIYELKSLFVPYTHNSTFGET